MVSNFLNIWILQYGVIVAPLILLLKLICKQCLIHQRFKCRSIILENNTTIVEDAEHVALW